MKAPLRPLAVTVSILLVAGCGDSGTEPNLQSFQNCAVAAYQLGTTVNGTLTTSDCRLTYQGSQFGEYVDQYGFTLESSRTVTVTMTSTQVDAYLIIWNRANGQIVDEDDDGAGGTNARIVRMLPAGNYVIGATTYDAGETGSYTLSSQ
jgi:hypothetical protein